MKFTIAKALIISCLFALSANGQSLIQISDSTGCPPHNVDFSVNVLNAIAYNWDFGNGQSSLLSEPSVIYTDTGVYTVSVTVTIAGGQQVNLFATNAVTVQPNPIASFSYIQNGNCPISNSVVFSSNSSFGNNFTWDFGDGNTSNLQNPSHSFDIDGHFYPTLSVENAIGCSHQFVMGPIVIDPLPIINLFPQHTDTCVLLHPIDFSLTGSYTSAIWEIESSVYQGDSVSHSFDLAGQHDIVVISDNSYGCVDTTVFPNAVSIDPLVCDIKIESGTRCMGDSLEFRLSYCQNWQYADVQWLVNGVHVHNGVYFNFVPNQAGNYTIRAEYLLNGCGAYKERNIVINSPQYVDIDLIDTSVCVGEYISPIATGGTFDSLNWTISGTAANGYQPHFIQSVPGAYMLHVRAKDQNGCMSLDSVNVLVSQAHAALQIDTLSGCAPLNISLNNLSSNGNYSLSTGDGTHLNYIPGNYVYMSPGNYNIELEVVDSNACVDYLSHPININVYDSEIALSSSEITGCAPYNLALNNFGIGYDTWSWDFGDGSSSTSQYPVHTYSVPGQYIVSLSTNNQYGCPSIIDTVFIVNIVEPIHLSMFDSLTCSGLIVSIDSNLINDALWTFDGIAMDSNATFTYPTLDNSYHNISLVYSDTNGCVSQLSQNYFLGQCSGGFVGSGSPPVPGMGFGGIVDTVKVCSPYNFNTGLLSLPSGSSLVELTMGDGSSYSSLGAIHTFDSLGYFSIHAVINTNGIIDTLQYFQVYNVTSYDMQAIISSVLISCDSLKYILQNVGSSNSFWSFNQGLQLIGDSISITISNQYYSESVNVTAFNSIGCADFAQFNLNNNVLEELFSVDNSACVQEIMTFEAFTPNNVSWEFSDGIILNGDVVQRSFSTPGVYSLTITTTDSNNCTETYVYDSIVVRGVANDILVSDYHLCPSDTATLSYSSVLGTSTWYVNGLIQGNLPSIAINSPNANTYAIELLTFFEGCESVTVDTVWVHEINASMNVIQDKKCYPMTVSFNATTPSAVDWYWRFGDGNYSQGTSNVNHTYSNSPTQTAKLFVTDAYGCVDSTSNGWFNTWNINAQASQSAGCAPLGVNFTLPSTVQSAVWSFGDGNYSQNVNASHIYTSAGGYDPNVSIIMIDGCLDTMSLDNQITVNETLASASINYNAGCAPIQASFISSGSMGDFFEWDFGDGSSSLIENPSHTYNTGGAYNVSLIVSDVNGCSDTAYIQNSVNVYNPIADFSVNQSILCVGDTLDVINQSQSSSSYLWHFGDGSSSTLMSPNHIYSDTGYYQIVLSVADSMGCTSSMVFDSLINIVARPNALFTINHTIFCIGDSLVIDSIQSNYLSEMWTLDGTSIQNFSWINIDTGVHVVGHTVGNGACNDYYELTYHVYSPIDASIIAPSMVCESDSILILSSVSSGGVWSGIGVSDSSSGIANLAHVPSGIHPFYYNIGGVCPSSDSVLVEILPMPDANIIVDSIICENHGSIAIGSTSQFETWTLNGVVVSDSINVSTNLGTHILIHTIDNGICMDTDTLSIEVIAKPTAYLEVFNDIYCFGDSSIAYLGLADTNCQVSWMFTSMDGGDIIVSSSLVLPGDGEWALSATITDDNGCQTNLSGSAFTVLDSIAPKSPQIIRSTVVNDEFVYTEWSLENQNDINKFTAYILYRRDSVGWSEIAVLPPYKMSFSDYNLDVFNAQYEYKLETIQRCHNRGGISHSNSILLEHDKVEGMDRFRWNPYLHWEEGVNRYELQYLRNDGTWETVETLNPGTTKILR